MAVSIFSRKRDLVYLIHFCLAIPLVFIMDSQALYPPAFVPEWLASIKQFYVNTYKDQFFINTPHWFELFIWSEIFIQAPVMIWAVGGLLRNSPKVPVVLLPFSSLLFTSTATCMFEYAHWPVPLSQKLDLTTLYGPYLALSAFMLVDMTIRVNAIIDGASSQTQTAGIKKLQ